MNSDLSDADTIRSDGEVAERLKGLPQLKGVWGL